LQSGNQSRDSEIQHVRGLGAHRNCSLPRNHRPALFHGQDIEVKKHQQRPINGEHFIYPAICANPAWAQADMLQSVRRARN
jgi:hypothetical protein